jgi:peptidyl-prolyl cis-trans isomerase D
MQAFQVGGEFSIDVYRAVLANNGMSPTGFERLQRRQLELLELESGISESTFLTPAEFRRYIELNNERREVAYVLFRADDFLDQVEVGDAEIATHYEANSDRYMSPETIDIEYIALSQADVASEIDVSDEDLRAYYESQRDQFQTQEERRVRHILINIEDGDVAAAEAEAEAVMARLDAGEDFAAVATDASDDAGTRNQGGDLGWIARGTLPGAFEDALYSMEVGEVRGPVESDFGVHVMQLDEVRAGAEQPFEAVAEELREQYQTELADQLFYDRANALADSAFDAYDELATVAADLDLPLQTIAAFPRSGDPSVFSNSAAVVQAAFDPEILDQGINSPLVELSDNEVLVLRVTEHNLPAAEPLQAVSEEIGEELSRIAAEDLAADAADTFVDAVPVGEESEENVTEHGGAWFERRWVQRSDAQVPTEIVATVFDLAEPVEGSPVRERVPMATGDQAIAVLYGMQAGRPDDIAREQRDQQQRELANQAAGVEMAAYVEEVQSQATVRVPQEVLEPQGL